MTENNLAADAPRLLCDPENRFPSLLTSAAEAGLLGEDDYIKIQTDLLSLLAYETNRFTGGLSSSVRIETAQQLSESAIYALSVAVDSFSSPAAALDALKEKGVNELHGIGLRRIQVKINTVRHLYHLTEKTRLTTENITYNSTSHDGIAGFFKLYDPRFGAHITHITADYPILIPAIGTGIEFIQQYLQSLYCENLFCACFDADDIRTLLQAYSPEWRDLVFNISGQVLISSLGRVLLGQSCRPLLLSRSAAAHLNSGAGDISFDALNSAADALCNELELNRDTRQYLKKHLPELCRLLYAAATRENFPSVFISP